MKIDRDREACIACHVSDEITALDESQDFINHHDSYDAFFNGKKAVMDCVDCHNPHQPVKYATADNSGITATCEGCHLEQTQYAKIEYINHGGECINCHMPQVTQVAVGNPEAFTADLRTHLMAINPLAVSEFEGGAAYLTLEYACGSCHHDGGVGGELTDQELIDLATNYHSQELSGSVTR
jgi:hypothetical protein